MSHMSACCNLPPEHDFTWFLGQEQCAKTCVVQVLRSWKLSGLLLWNSQRDRCKVQGDDTV